MERTCCFSSTAIRRSWRCNEALFPKAGRGVPGGARQGPEDTDQLLRPPSVRRGVSAHPAEERTWPKDCLLVTVGLPYRPDSPRVAAAAEPYPGRWTCHIPVSEDGPDRRGAAGVAAGGLGLRGEQAMRYTDEELAEARRSIASTLSKCEKALEKLRPGSASHHPDGAAHPGLSHRPGPDRPGAGGGRV